MSFAIIETGGKQYKISEGDVLHTEKHEGMQEGDTMTFDKVLLVSDGDDVKIGTPYVDGVKIEGKLQNEGREKKIDVIRFRSKSRHHRKYGHRQPFSEFVIGKIGEGKSSKKSAPKETAQKADSKKEEGGSKEDTTKNPDDIGNFDTDNKAPKKRDSVATEKSRNTNEFTENTMEEKETRT